MYPIDNYRELACAIADAFSAQPSLWGQGSHHHPPAVQFCLREAVVRPRDCGKATTGAMFDLIRQLEARLHPGWGLFSWNDAPGRTAQDVIDLLRKVQMGRKLPGLSP